MANAYNIEKSFLARLNVANTQYPGPVGYWEYSPGLNGRKAWHSSGWLTTSRPDIQPLALWFGAVEQPGEAAPVYEIRLWTGSVAHPTANQRVDISTNGYLGLYGHSSKVGPLWRIEPVAASRVHLKTLDNKGVGVDWEQAFWTSARKGSYLCVGAAPAAVFEMELVRMGVPAPA
ncbi:hypothetical protein [Pseudomonas entomophila]|uniref:hypothetical protein n=1 Tax=Pseudomonas entomophila TaxID=312306 RepID=UPI001F02A769|nr:hypothetical protein [Pseudomonas entomophila]MCG8294554.1 hypothetical protein [Pseudomonas entomophila]